MYSDSALSLVVPLCVITLVFITKRVVLSLFVGIVIASIMMNYGDFLGILGYIFTHIAGVFYTSQSGAIEIKSNSLHVFGFLILLGILTQTIAHSGGIGAFVKWARTRIKTAKGSEFVAFVAGIVVFIDDYFNALTVGQISKYLNDVNHSTRERLAYIIDSTSAPICILIPISSWGAYIIGILEEKHIAQQISGIGGGGFFALLSSVVYNYYAWFALLGVILTIFWQINLKAMRKNRNVGVSDFLQSQKHSSSHIWLLVLPIGVLITSVAGMIFWSGYQECKSLSPIAMLQHTQTGFALFWGGCITLCVTFVISIRHLETDSLLPIIKYGTLSMLPAILILIFAWAIGPIINDDMQTGIYLANLCQDVLQSHSSVLLPLVLFAISCFIGFATGTSWGTFAIILPIAASLAQSTHTDFTLAIAAVLSGAVYGDHASPISDTTILSATGAGCSAQSHFITQFPYVNICAFGAIIAFGVASVSTSAVLGYLIGGSVIIAIFYYFKHTLSFACHSK